MQVSGSTPNKQFKKIVPRLYRIYLRKWSYKAIAITTATTVVRIMMNIIKVFPLACATSDLDMLFEKTLSNSLTFTERPLGQRTAGRGLCLGAGKT
jgi:hypothetical protein